MRYIEKTVLAAFGAKYTAVFVTVGNPSVFVGVLGGEGVPLILAVLVGEFQDRVTVMLIECVREDEHDDVIDSVADVEHDDDLENDLEHEAEYDPVSESNEVTEKECVLDIELV